MWVKVIFQLVLDFLLRHYQGHVNKIKAHQKDPKFQEPSAISVLRLKTQDRIFSPSFVVFQHGIIQFRTLTLLHEGERTFLMCKIAVLRPAASKFRCMHPSKGRWVSTVTPRKSADNDAVEGQVSKSEAGPDPIVAFSRPPPVPPVLGPLVALSLLDSWLKRDSNDE